MTRILSPLNILFLLLLTSLVVFGLFTIPSEQMLPVHWNINGEVDFTLPAYLALWIGPLECIVVILVIFVAKNRLSSEEFLAGRSLMEASVSIAIAAGLFVQAVIVFSANGVVFDVPQLATVFIGIVMLIIGNYLPKSQANRAAGIRFPWTMSSPTVWAKTHQFAGKCFISAGAVIVAIGVVNIAAPASIIAALSIICLAVLAVTFYSYSIRELN